MGNNQMNSLHAVSASTKENTECTAQPVLTIKRVKGHTKVKQGWINQSSICLWMSWLPPRLVRRTHDQSVINTFVGSSKGSTSGQTTKFSQKNSLDQSVIHSWSQKSRRGQPEVNLPRNVLWLPNLEEPLTIKCNTFVGSKIKQGSTRG